MIFKSIYTNVKRLVYTCIRINMFKHLDRNTIKKNSCHKLHYLFYSDFFANYVLLKTPWPQGLLVE